MKYLYITLVALLGCFSSRAVAVGPILGSPTVCIGAVTVLTDTTADTTTGGTWSSSNPLVATVSSAGYGSGCGVTGVASGTSVITFSTSGGFFSTLVVTVNPAPAGITGSGAVCVGSTTTLADGVAGGVWSSSSTAVGSIGVTTGVVLGIAAGITDITYTLPTGCYAATAVTVSPSPSPISGTLSVCEGLSTTLSDASSGGIWASSSFIVLIGSSTGIVTDLYSGTSTITYTVAGGCYTTAVVTADPTPSAILGSLAICDGGATALTDATGGGTWSLGTVSVATIGATSGVAYGISTGISGITYILPTGCLITAVLTVNPLPAAISGVSAVCVGSSITLSDAGGGTWVSSTPAVATVGSSSGVVLGISAGNTIITYTNSTGCQATFLLTVVAAPPSISGAASVCSGSTTTLTDATAGGTWSNSEPGILSVGAATGLVTGIDAGTSNITYTIASGCYVIQPETVNITPAAISGSASVCIGATTTLADAIGGGTWSSSAATVASIDASGIAGGIAAGVTNITYQLATGCYASTPLTVNSLPAITASATESCGGTYSLTGSGAGTGSYSWSPATGLSCATCAAPVATTSVTLTYTLTGTDAHGCIDTASITINGNRISGYISLTATATDTLKVWLIQFNPTDSSLTAEDSTLTCMDSGTPYYEFDSEPAGNYLVKAALLGSIPGTSGYVPTYGLSSNIWDAATNITHASATDTQHINMIYGTVPSGPGFIGGLISSGAGRGTSSGVPVAGMLVYLENASGTILTYTYTNGSGNYSFTGLAYGTYNVYPADYRYHTTPWLSVTLSATNDSATAADFYQNTTLHTITPNSSLTTVQIANTTKIDLYPNPAANALNVSWENQQTGDATVTITDVAGREVYSNSLAINTASGSKQLDIHELTGGIYFVAIRSATISYTNKLLIEK